VTILDTKVATPRKRPVLAHEYGHKHATLKDNYITANAFQTYFERINNTKNNSQEALGQWEEILTSQGLIPKIDERQKKVRRILKNPFLEHRKLKSLKGHSVSEFGLAMGKNAMMIEIKAKKPGLGLFVIRDLSKGIPFSVAMKQALNGEYDKELIEWINKNPRLARIIARAHPKEWTG
jgi:hypothetical protein